VREENRKEIKRGEKAFLVDPKKIYKL